VKNENQINEKLGEHGFERAAARVDSLTWC